MYWYQKTISKLVTLPNIASYYYYLLFQKFK